MAIVVRLQPIRFAKVVAARWLCSTDRRPSTFHMMGIYLRCPHTARLAGFSDHPIDRLVGRRILWTTRRETQVTSVTATDGHVPADGAPDCRRAERVIAEVQLHEHLRGQVVRHLTEATDDVLPAGEANIHRILGYRNG